MPELPEVETIRLQAEKKLLGHKIKKIDVLAPKMFLGDSTRICNSPIIAVSRRAKVLQIKFKNKKSLLVHFKLNGQLILSSKFSAKGGSASGGKNQNSISDRFTRIILYLDDGDYLLFNDQRKFAWMKVVETKEYEKEKTVPEPLKPEFTVEYLQKICEKSGKPIKILLMDQEKIGGLGNIYANEALYLAKINPQKQAKKLSPEEIKLLHDSIIRIIESAIKLKGSSGKDGEYKQIDGSPGEYQNHFQVYQQDGQKCQRCGNIIKRVTIGGRGTFFCPNCQK